MLMMAIPDVKIFDSAVVHRMLLIYSQIPLTSKIRRDIYINTTVTGSGDKQRNYNNTIQFSKNICIVHSDQLLNQI